MMLCNTDVGPTSSIASTKTKAGEDNNFSHKKVVCEKSSFKRQLKDNGLNECASCKKVPILKLFSFRSSL